MKSWVVTSSPLEDVDCENVNHTMLVQDDGCLRKSVQLSLDELSLNSSEVVMTAVGVGDGRWTSKEC